MNNKFGFVDRIKIYCKYPKYVIYDAKICINRHKENVLFSIRKKIINSFLNRACKCRFNTNDGQINSAILFPCTIVSMVLLEHFKRIDWLGIHSISVDTRSDEVVTATIALARPGLLIGKGGKDIDAVRERLSELFGKETNIDIKEINDVNKEKILTDF